MNSFFCVKYSVYGGEAGDCCVKKEHEKRMKRKLSLLRNHLKFYAIFVVDDSGFSLIFSAHGLLSVDVGKKKQKIKKKSTHKYRTQNNNTKTRRMVEQRVEEEKQR